MAKTLPPVHPGEVLREEVMVTIGPSANRLAARARGSGIARSRNRQQAARHLGRHRVRLGRYFDTTPQFWLNLQARYDLDVAREANGKAIERAIKPRQIAS